MYISTNKIIKIFGLSINNSLNFNRKFSVSCVLLVESGNSNSNNENEEVHSSSKNSPIPSPSPSSSPSVDSPSGYTDISHESKNEFIAVSKSHPGELADKFSNNPWGLALEAHERMKSLREFGKASVLELVERRLNTRTTVSERKLEKYDDKTGDLVDIKNHKLELAVTKGNKVRDDALDTVHGYQAGNDHAQSIVKNVLNSQKDMDASAKQEQKDFNEDVLKSLPGNQLDEYSDVDATEKEEIEKNPSLNNATNLSLGVTGAPSSDPIPGPSSGVTTVSSNKRKADEADLDEGDSALDYVLKKQQSELFDPTDDTE
jgi:hypothetical protein